MQGCVVKGYNTAMPDKRQNPVSGSDASEPPRLAIRRHTDRCFHEVEEVVHEGPPAGDVGPDAGGSGVIAGYIIDGVMIDVDDVAEVRTVPDGGDRPACKDV